MGIRSWVANVAADATRWGSRAVLHRNGGNVPGRIALCINPRTIAQAGAHLQRSVLVTGTNGKTTTTGLLADLLAAGGAHVACNRSGNNMEPGIAAALLEARSTHPDTGCFECDELYVPRVMPQLAPQALVLLNLSRDQLDRYGEIDHVQDVLAAALEQSPNTTLVYNADDPRCASVARRVANKTVAFGLSEAPGAGGATGTGDAAGAAEDAGAVSSGGAAESAGAAGDSAAGDVGNIAAGTTAGKLCEVCGAPLAYDYVQYGHLGSYHCPVCGWERPSLDCAVSNIVLGPEGYSCDLEDRRAVSGLRRHLRTSYTGRHMLYDIAAVFAACRELDVDTASMQRVLDAYEPAQGRGKRFALDGGITAQSLLAKNPAGFDRVIDQLIHERVQSIALFLNDNDADGHDVSWIWDVAFERLAQMGETGHQRVVFVGGTRREDMALRIKYADLGVQIVPVMSVHDAVEQLCGGPYDERLAVVCNYTAFAPAVAELEELSATWVRRLYISAGNATPADKRSLQKNAVEESAVDLKARCPLRIVHLYPDMLNLYGDVGNVIVLRKRCAWRGIPVRVDCVQAGDTLDLTDADIVVLGGGADRDQRAAAAKLMDNRDALAAYVADGGVLLAICGGYQLLGRRYVSAGDTVEGLHILDIDTVAGDTRMIGNVAVKTPLFPIPLVGFENHAGRTTLGAGEVPLGRPLVAGTGNNGRDEGEGVLHGNVVGTYLHGPVLSKNPELADWLITQALRRRGETMELAALSGVWERAAHAAALRLVDNRS